MTADCRPEICRIGEEVAADSGGARRRRARAPRTLSIFGKEVSEMGFHNYWANLKFPWAIGVGPLQAIVG